LAATNKRFQFQRKRVIVPPFIVAWREGAMIVLIGATSIVLTALQASINAPTDAFRNCLRQAAAKATTEKVGADAIDAYLRNACSSEMQTLKSAVVAFRIKNGMAKKAASSDAEMTVDDYVATPVDKYKYLATMDAAPPKADPAKAATPPVTPASVSSQPPKP
jgi:hypothetical protein